MKFTNILYKNLNFTTSALNNSVNNLNIGARRDWI